MDWHVVVLLLHLNNYVKNKNRPTGELCNFHSKIFSYG